MRSIRGLALITALTMLTPGCGYALAGRGSFLPADIRVVGIPLLENRTTTPRLNQILTEKVRTEFINRVGSKYEIIPTTNADAVLSGAIMSLRVEAVGLDQQRASRYQFTVTMRVQFTDTRNSQTLWSNEVLTFREEYDLRSRGAGQVDGAVLLEQEGPATDRMATDLARTVVSAILEAF